MRIHETRGSRTTVVWTISLLLVLVVVLALAACGGSSTTASNSPPASPTWTPTMSPAPIPVVKPGEKLPPIAELEAAFAYDASEPLGFVEHPENDVDWWGGPPLRAVTYQSGGDQAAGYLMVPPGEGPFPVVVYAPGWNTGADMWAEDALALARKGYAGLLVEQPSTQFFSYEALTDIASYVKFATRLRRGLDLLETLPQIDTSRIGFVGWSNGSYVGALLAGLEDRIKSYVLIGEYRFKGDSGFERESHLSAAEWDRYVAQMAVADNLIYVGNNKGSAFLFESGSTQGTFPNEALLGAAPKPKTWHVYTGGHETNAASQKYMRAWILKNL